jgi:hypothetical protein
MITMGSSKDGNFYLGKLFDLGQKKLLDDPILYDPADLTTHAVVTGMTGSGKTGLCVGLLEEAALEGIPAIVIDPKGDLTNLLLHFPDLAPADFQPWVDPEAARREGKSVEDFSAETAANWKKGLESWGLGSEQLTDLSQAVDFGLFTPGSTSGAPVNILSSFAAPDLEWGTNQETLREKISTIVTALLGLIGLSDIDPLRSREHILLSNIIENAWSSGKSLDLTELILQAQNPPFERLGAFPVNSFFPEKDRFELAMLLNNFLASPSFEVWRSGQPLDIGKLLYSPSGKARHNIFYIAHLSESERMFFVTLLFASVESWMRSQRGTSGLRALVYMDEILGFLPPVANPPSRGIMLRMLKQARAFGVGMLLATQNPVDVDYKGLSNAGTWIIGRLQTDQDKQRLLDGLDSAGGGLDRKTADGLISTLGKRTFLLHNVHSKAPQVFQTRWALNYLAGPLTRSQIPDLMKLVSPSEGAPAPAASAASATAQTVQAAPVQPAAAVETDGLTNTRPAAPTGAEEYILPNDLAYGEALKAANIGADAKIEQKGFVYRPALLAQAEINTLVRKYNLALKTNVTSLAQDARGQQVTWDDFRWHSFENSSLRSAALPDSRYAPIPAWMSEARQIKALQQDFSDWMLRSANLTIRVNEKLKLACGPEVTTAAFREQCSQAARDQMKAETDKIESTYKKKISDLQAKIKKQEREVDSLEDELGARRMEEIGNAGEILFSFLGGRKKSISTSMTKRRMTTKTKNDLEEEQGDLKDMQEQLKALEAEIQAALKTVQDNWAAVVNDVSEVPVTPYKKDVFLSAFGVAWLPYYALVINGQAREIPAFRPADL